MSLRFFTPLALTGLLLVLLTACNGSKSGESQCESCHRGLEAASPTHGDCTTCHGGDASSTDKTIAHRTMFGKKNPAAPEVWEKTCGRCHTWQVGRVRANLMTTNTGT